MCIVPDEGCHEVPDPIDPIDMMLVSLDPTRMPRPLPFITISGPMFMSILCCGEACGFGEAVGICIPGMFICICCGEGCGDADCLGDAGRAGIVILGMLLI